MAKKRRPKTPYDVRWDAFTAMLDEIYAEGVPTKNSRRLSMALRRLMKAERRLRRSRV